MSLKTWEFSMTSAMRVAMKENRYDIVNLYIKLERVSKKYLQNHTMKEGDSFIIPLEDGTFLRQHFYENFSTLTMINPDKSETIVISKEQSFSHEYIFLEGYTHALKNSGLGIGPRYPDLLEKTLREVKPGEVLVFDNGRSYVCKHNTNNSLRLIQTSSPIKIPHISEFEKSEELFINLSNHNEIQCFYSAIRDLYNDDSKFRVTTLHTAQELINRCIAGLDKKTKILQIGPNIFKIKRAFLSKNIAFYDEKGESISEEKIKILLAWLNAAPVVTEIERSEHTYQTEFNDNLFRNDLDALLSQGAFSEACQYIEGYCRANVHNLSINFNSYVNNEAISFVFRCIEGNCHIYKLSYNDGDYTKEPTKTEKVKLDDFVAFCKIKYNEVYFRIENNIQKKILQNYPNYHGEFVEKIIQNMTIKKIMDDKLILSNISQVSEDVITLTDSLESKLQYESECLEYE